MGDLPVIHTATAGEIAAVTAKATPVSGDFLLIEDSEASNAKKRITIGDLPGGSGGGVGSAGDLGRFACDSALNVAAGQFYVGIEETPANKNAITIHPTNDAGVDLTNAISRISNATTLFRIAEATDDTQYWYYRSTGTSRAPLAAGGGYQFTIVSVGGTMGSFVHGANYTISATTLGGTQIINAQHDFTIEFDADVANYFTFPVSEGFSASVYNRNVGTGVTAADFTNDSLAWRPPAAGTLLSIEGIFLNDGSTGSVFGSMTWQPWSVTYAASPYTGAPTVTQLQNTSVITVNTPNTVLRQGITSSGISPLSMIREPNGSTPSGIVHAFKNTNGSQTVRVQLLYTYLIGG